MAFLLDTSFEFDALTDIFDNTVGSTVSFDTTHPRTYGRALRFSQQGSASGSKRNIPAGKRQLVLRFGIYLPSAPAATQTMLTVNGPINLLLRHQASGAVNCLFNGGVAQSSSPAAGAYHMFDLNIDFTGATFTCDWKVDGAAQTQANIAGAPADPSLFNFFSAGANTIDYWMDDLRINDDPLTFPLADAAAKAAGVVIVTFGAVGIMPPLSVQVTSEGSREKALAAARLALSASADFAPVTFA